MDLKSYSDNILAARIKGDDLVAFKMLYDRYKKKLYYFSLKYLGDHPEAEEVVQNVFISVWEHRKSIDTSRSIKSYIFRSAVNTIYNFLKKEGIRRRYLDSEVNKQDLSINQTYDKLFKDDLEKRLNNILVTLPPQQQKIFILSRSEGYSNDEISQKLGLSVRTVENQIYRATKVIKDNLK